MTSPPPNVSRRFDWLGVLARWILGATFVYLGAVKTLHPVDFLKLLREYDLVQNYWWLNAIAGVLPWLEIVCGLLLLSGIAVRGTAVVVSGLLAAFTAVIFHRVIALMAPKSLAFCAVKFNCGCGNGEVIACHKLFENTCLILLALTLAFGHGRKCCFRYQL